MAYTTIDDPEAYFQVKTYTGNGSADHAITFGGENALQPDINWIKNRGQADSHMIHDSVRGVGEEWSIDVGYPTLAIASANDLTSFDSDGFTISATTDAVNKNTETYVSFNWKESVTSGVDIVTFTGNQTGRDIAHSLSAVPHVMLIKNRDHNDGAHIYHITNGEDCTMEIATSGAKNCAGVSGIWNSTAPTSSVFSVGTNGNINKTSSPIFVYLFAPKQGFSKFSSFVGNGNADGPFVYTGFRPAFLLIKNVSGGDSGDNWFLLDAKRSPHNPVQIKTCPDLPNADTDATWVAHDFLSNGFKIRTNEAGINQSGDTIIYMAFAEAPFVNSNGVPCNAR
jgi:hypothetical protein